MKIYIYNTNDYITKTYKVKVIPKIGEIVTIKNAEGFPTRTKVINVNHDYVYNKIIITVE